MSARVNMPKKARSAHKIKDLLGIYFASLNAKISHAAKIISTIILKAKFLPVIKGKKSELVIISEITGPINTPHCISYLKILFVFIIFLIYLLICSPCSQTFWLLCG